MATYSRACSKVGSFTWASNFTLYVVLTERDVNVANNTSYVDYNVYCQASGSGSLSANHYEYFIINGETKKDTTVKVEVTGPNANIPIASGSIGPITHNADGSKTITFGAIISATAYGVYAEMEDSFTLTTIPRTSMISLSSSSITLGNDLTIYTNRASSSFTHNLYYQIDNGNWNLITTEVGATCTWTTPISAIASHIPNATSKTITIIGETYSNGTYIGASTASLTVNVPSSAVPTINSFTLSGAINGIWVETLCNVAATSSASGVYSSTITNYKVEMLKGSSVLKTGYGSSVTFDTNNLNISANTDIVLRLTVTDSRGRTVTTSTTINVKKYAKPVITGRYVYRCTSTGVRDENGTYMKVGWTYTYTNISGVTNLSTSVSYRKEGVSNWTSITMASGSATIVSGISTDSHYEVYFYVSDGRNNVSITDVVPTGYVTVDYRSGGKGIAFGKVSESDAFECNMEGDFKKNITWNSLTISNVDYNNYKKSGIYYFGSGCTNAPYNLDWCRVLVMGQSSAEDVAQIAMQITTERMFIRTSSNSVWKEWKEVPRYVVGNGTFNTIGWYRVCRIDTTGHPGISALLNISTNYSYTEPCSALISVLTTWKHGKLTQLNATYCGTHKAISKVRLLYDDTNACFYVDVYYTLTSWNGIYVRNDNIISDKVNILTPTLATGSYTNLQEITISY